MTEDEMIDLCVTWIVEATNYLLSAYRSCTQYGIRNYCLGMRDSHKVVDYFDVAFHKAIVEERIFLSIRPFGKTIPGGPSTAVFVSTKRPTKLRSLDAGWMA